MLNIYARSFLEASRFTPHTRLDNAPAQDDRASRQRQKIKAVATPLAKAFKGKD